MHPYLQLIDHDPENGTWGDCGRTVIACLLNLRPELVPHFYDNDADGLVGQELKNHWLAERNLREINIPYNGDMSLSEIMVTMKHTNPGAWYMLTGKSGRKICNHVVICRDDEIVHDPSPNKSGVIGPCIEDGLWWISFLGIL